MYIQIYICIYVYLCIYIYISIYCLSYTKIKTHADQLLAKHAELRGQAHVNTYHTSIYVSRNIQTSKCTYADQMKADFATTLARAMRAMRVHIHVPLHIHMQTHIRVHIHIQSCSYECIYPYKHASAYHTIYKHVKTQIKCGNNIPRYLREQLKYTNT